MRSVKLILWTAAIFSALAALLLVWNESKTTCGEFYCKMFETLFMLVAIALTKEAASIELEEDGI